MATQLHDHEFHSNNSPWTEMYSQYCQQEDNQAMQSMPDAQAEQEPTHDALADVYNRDPYTSSKRF